MNTWSVPGGHLAPHSRASHASHHSNSWGHFSPRSLSLSCLSFFAISLSSLSFLVIFRKLHHPCRHLCSSGAPGGAAAICNAPCGAAPSIGWGGMANGGSFPQPPRRRRQGSRHLWCARPSPPNVVAVAAPSVDVWRDSWIVVAGGGAPVVVARGARQLHSRQSRFSVARVFPCPRSVLKFEKGTQLTSSRER